MLNYTTTLENPVIHSVVDFWCKHFSFLYRVLTVETDSILILYDVYTGIIRYTCRLGIQFWK